MNPLNAKEPARMGFGDRLYEAMGAHGPVCVGIDPHAALLARWGLDDDARGLREFSLRVVEALGGRAAALKPQSAFFERHGSQGVAVLEEVVAACRELGTLCVVDAKRGDIGSTMEGYADAYLSDASPLAGDAVTRTWAPGPWRPRCAWPSAPAGACSSSPSPRIRRARTCSTAARARACPSPRGSCPSWRTSMPPVTKFIWVPRGSSWAPQWARRWPIWGSIWRHCAAPSWRRASAPRAPGRRRSGMFSAARVPPCSRPRRVRYSNRVPICGGSVRRTNGP